MSLLAIAGVTGCDACPLRATWGTLNHPAMPACGDLRDLDVFVLGEAPDENEDIAGMAFVGRAGQLLHQYYPKGLRTRWDNAVRCRPAANRPPTPSETRACALHWREEVARTKPKVILAVGGIALSQLLGKSAPILSWRGLPFPVDILGHRCWALPCLHPAFVLRSGVRDSDPAMVLFKRDLTALSALVKRPLPALLPPFKDRVECVGEFTEKHMVRLLRAPRIGLDYETDGLSPHASVYGMVSCAIADAEGAIAFPLALHAYPALMRRTNKQRLREFLQSYRGEVVAHNLVFDAAWSIHHFSPQIVAGKTWLDSMAALRVHIERESPLNLDDGALMVLGQRIKSETGISATGWQKADPVDYLRYNGVDASACLALYNALERSAVKTHQLEFDRLSQSAVSVALMQDRAVLLDHDRLREMTRQTQDELNEAAEHARKLSGKPDFNASSPQQVKEHLHHLGIHLDNADEEELSACNHPLAEAVLKVRRLSKLLGTYLQSWPRVAGKDGALHPRYTVCRVATARLSSEDPNIQNVPKRKDRWIREAIRAPDGHVIVSIDYHQIELVVLAMICGEPVLRDEIWAKADLHTRWAVRTAELYPPVLDQVARTIGSQDEKKIRKALRDDIKRGITFALPYGASDRTPARILRIPPAIGEQLAHEFWQRYPVLRAWQREQREGYLRHGEIVVPFTQRVRCGLLGGNEPINNPIQGSAADIVIAAMTRLAKRALAEDAPWMQPVLNVHDDLTFYLPENDLEPRVRTIVEEMVRPVHPLITLPLSVEATYGTNWGNQTPLAEYSSVDFGHRRARGAASPDPRTAYREVSTEDFLGGAWSAPHCQRASDVAATESTAPQLLVRRAVRGGQDNAGADTSAPPWD